MVNEEEKIKGEGGKRGQDVYSSCGSVRAFKRVVGMERANM
jgi:hypothetical protein